MSIHVHIYIHICIYEYIYNQLEVHDVLCKDEPGDEQRMCMYMVPTCLCVYVYGTCAKMSREMSSDDSWILSNVYLRVHMHACVYVYTMRGLTPGSSQTCVPEGVYACMCVYAMRGDCLVQGPLKDVYLRGCICT